MNQEREQIARIILGPKSSWNCGQAKTWNLTEWAQYPETTRALAKADAILALRSGGEGWRPAIAEIAAERRRQMDIEGWSPAHDDEHADRSLALAAACYAMFASVSDSARKAASLPASLTTTGKPIHGWAAFLELWPWDRKWWKPKDPRRDLIRAGALIVAEIERLDRASPSTHGEG